MKMFKNYTPQQLRDAIEIELQKTDDIKMATVIAMKRLKKDNTFYEKMEKGIKYNIRGSKTMKKIFLKVLDGVFIPLKKAQTTKYIRRIPKAGGGYTYIYKEDDKGKGPKQLGGDTGKMVSKKLDELGIEKKDHKSVVSFLKDQGFKLSDIENVDENEYGYTIEVDGEEWLAATPSNAYDAAKESHENLIDDMGVTAYNIWESHIDTDMLGRDLAMDGDFNYGYDEPENFLDEEPAGEDGDWSEKQKQKAGEMADDAFQERVTDDPIGYLEEIYGDIKEFGQLENYVDTDSLIEEAINIDGIGHTLATYDGDEHTYGNMDYYRTN